MGNHRFPSWKSLAAVGAVLLISLTLACGGGGGAAGGNGPNPPAAVQPAFSIQPTDQTVTAGSTATFVVAATGTPTPAFLWERSVDGLTWTPIPGATSTSLGVSVQLADHGTKFRAKASNSAGTVTSNSASLFVASGNGPMSLSNGQVVPGETVQGNGWRLYTIQVPTGATFLDVRLDNPTIDPDLYVRLGSAPTLSQSDAVSAGISAESVQIAQPGAGTWYIGVYGYDAASPSTYTITASYGPGGGGGTSAPAFTTQPLSQTVAPGTNVTFSTTATGTPAPTYQWERNSNGTAWAAINGETGASYTLTAQTGDNGAQFRAIASNSAGIATSNSATLTVMATIPGSYSISGKVTDPSNAALSSVTVTCAGASTSSASSDASGNFTISGLANGSYVVTPAKTGYSFNPASTTVLVSGANVTGKDFTAVSSGPSSGGGAFVPTGFMTIGRMYHTATPLGDGTVLIIGGDTPLGGTGSAEIYNPSTKTFTATLGSMAVKRAQHAAVLLRNGKVLVVGGGSYLLSMYKMAEIYDPSTQKFTTVGPMVQDRSLPGCFAVLLGDGRVLIGGGASLIAEIYDPILNKFIATGSMVVLRFMNPTVTVLNDGKVLVVGGGSNSAELYNPATGIFTATGAPTAVTSYHLTTLLTDGRVLLTGSSSSGVAELYDPSTGRFSATGVMGRLIGSGHSAVRLQRGSVLVVGLDVGDLHISPPELYDPTTSLFSPTNFMTKSSDYHTAILLADGSVLVAGGLTGGGIITDRAELYSVGNASFAPIFTAQPQSQTVTAGASATFTVAASGTPAPSYLWERSGDGLTWAVLPGATQASYTFSVQASDNLAKFRAKATNSVGTAISNVATLTVAATPPSSGVYGSRYYPMSSGNYWQYEGVSISGSRYTDTNTIVSASDQAATIQYTNSTFIAGKYTNFNIQLNGVDMSTISLGYPGGTSLIYTPSQPILLPDSSFGSHLVFTGTAQGGSFSQTVTIDSKLMGPETVTVPAGTFDTVRIDTVQTTVTGTSTLIMYISDYYATGIGRVKSRTVSSLDPSSQTDISLISYIVH